jgi:acetyltransferase-like isoleucine patch superfamily enzyme
VNPLAALVNAFRFGGIRIARGAAVTVRGTFEYGNGCSIGAGTHIFVPERTVLSLGKNCYVGRSVEVGSGGRIRIGDHTSIQDRAIILGDVTVGRYCSLAPNVYISSGRHNFDVVPHALIKDQDRLVRASADLSAAQNKPVVVEDDCWLGINVAVMPGLVIGKGAVVGANSVVTRDVAPYSIVAGVPAKLVKKRLDFLPPRHISHRSAADLPYFYAGFESSRECLDRNAAADGLVAEGDFVLSLSAPESRSLHLKLKRLTPGDSTLIYSKQRAPIRDEFHEVIFTLDPSSMDSSRIPLRAEPRSARVAVAEAWVG